jgi:hypothetical protein
MEAGQAMLGDPIILAVLGAVMLFLIITAIVMLRDVDNWRGR